MAGRKILGRRCTRFLLRLARLLTASARVRGATATALGDPKQLFGRRNQETLGGRPLRSHALVVPHCGLSMVIEIAAQPAASAGVARFLKRAPRLLIGGEWVPPRSL